MIELKDVRKSYKMGDSVVRALSGVTLRIEPGEFVAIMGPSGSGKSTLMHILGLLDVPDEGSYRLDDVEVARHSEDDLASLRSRSIGFVFQKFNLLARTSAEENVALPMLYAQGHFQRGWAKHLLDRVGLGSRLDHRPNELSGGQQQRVAIARALVNRPRIIFADEPTGNLDSASEKEIMGMLTELNRQGITVVIVTHEPDIARYVSRVIRMRDGAVQSDERQEGLLAQPSAADTASQESWAIATSPVAERGRTSLLGQLLSPFTSSSVHFRQAIRSLMANKARSALSMLGILIGVAAVIALLGLGAGAQDSIEDQLSSLGSNMLVLRPGGRKSSGVALGAGAVSRVTVEDAEDIRESIETVKGVSPTVSGRGQIVFEDRNWNTQISGAGADYPKLRAAIPVAGRFFTEQENKQRDRVAALGMSVVRELFGTRNPLGETIKINRISFQVIGVMPAKGSGPFGDQDDIIIVPVNTAMRRLFGKTFVDSIDIGVTESEKIDGTIDAILSLMKTRHRIRPENDDAFQVRNMAEIQAAMTSTSRIMSMLLAAIASISLLVGGIGIMNIMLVSVSERTREIGLRKAVGANRRSIQAQFLVEAVVISALGGLLGIGLGFALSELASVVTGWKARISPESIALATLFSAVIGIVFGFWPARKASALHPIDALRHE